VTRVSDHDDLLDPEAVAVLWRAADAPGAPVVYERGTVRWLEFGDGAVQSRVDMRAPHRLALPYTRAMAAALLFADAPAAALLLGLGGGAMVHFLLHHLPEVTVRAVEAEPAVIEAARRWFGVRPDPRLRIDLEDARLVAARPGPRYDLVVLDLFDQAGLPGWMREPQIYRAARARLRNPGVLVANLWVDAADEFLHVMGGIRDAFDGRVLVLTVPGYRNLVVLGFRGGPDRFALGALYQRACAWQARTGIDYADFVDGLRQANLTQDGYLLL
jgi:spermidine synthase